MNPEYASHLLPLLYTLSLLVHIHQQLTQLHVWMQVRIYCRNMDIEVMCYICCRNKVRNNT